MSNVKTQCDGCYPRYPEHYCVAKAKANPEININIGGGGEDDELGKAKDYHENGFFDGIEQVPTVLSKLVVKDRDLAKAGLHFSVNWMPMPQVYDGCTQCVPEVKPTATFAIVYDDGKAVRELLRVKEAVAELGMPAVTSYSKTVEGVGEGEYALLAELNKSVMNDPENPGQFSFELEMS